MTVDESLQYLNMRSMSFPGLEPGVDAAVCSLVAHIERIENGYARYEYVRTLNPRQFAELYKKTINGEGRFDDLVDAGMKDRNQRNGE